MKQSQVDEYKGLESFSNFDLTYLIIKNLKINADVIKLRNITAKDVKANIELNEKKQLNINDFKFKVANGILDGNFTYNLNNNNTAITLNARNIDANDLSYAIFDLNNQIYGDLTGNLKLSCNGADFNKCMQTLNGNTVFNVFNQMKVTDKLTGAKNTKRAH